MVFGRSDHPLGMAADTTVSVAVPLIDPEVAVMVVCPVDPPLVASPDEEIVATLGLEELQVAVLVMSCEVPSVFTPSALYCCVELGGREEFRGLRSMTVNPLDAVTENPLFRVEFCPSGFCTVTLREPMVAVEAITMVAVS